MLCVQHNDLSLTCYDLSVASRLHWSTDNEIACMNKFSVLEC